jgi:hypothetical protein
VLAGHTQKVVLTVFLAAVGAACSDGSGPDVQPLPPGVTGSLLYFSTPSSNVLRVLDLANGQDRVIYTGDGIVSVTAFGAEVVLGIISNVGPPTTIDFTYSLRRILLDGASGTGVGVFDNAGPELRPVYSRDGRLAYFGGDYLHLNSGIWINGSRVISCVAGQGGPGCAEGLSWSADGLSLLVYDGASTSRVVLATRATTPMIDATGNHMSAARETPDGLNLLYYPAYPNTAEGWIADIDGSNPRRFTECDYGTGIWSPDSKWILCERALLGSHYLVSRSGGEEIPITVGVVVWAWIP